MCGFICQLSVRHSGIEGSDMDLKSSKILCKILAKIPDSSQVWDSRDLGCEMLDNIVTDSFKSLQKPIPLISASSCKVKQANRWFTNLVSRAYAIKSIQKCSKIS